MRKKPQNSVRNFLNQSGMQNALLEMPGRKGIDNIQDPGIPGRISAVNDPEEKHFNLVRRLTQSANDIPFFHVTRYALPDQILITPGTLITPRVLLGAEQNLYTKRVPSQQKMVIDRFQCFIIVTRGGVPAHGYATADTEFAYPLEFYNMFDFKLSFNGRIPTDISYSDDHPDPPFPAGYNTRNEGWSILTEDITRDVSPYLGSNVVVAPGGSLVEVSVRNRQYTYANAGYRFVVYLGIAIGGFFSPEEFNDIR